MSSTVDDPRIAAAPAGFPSGRIALGPLGWRALLLVGCALAVVAAYLPGDPSVLEAADPDLAVLLRAMALIKAALVVAALAILWWRFRWPVSSKVAGGYLVGTWLAAGATTMIWQLTHVAPAAALFHVGEIALLLLAWRDSARAR